MPIISTQDLTKRYGGLTAVDHITFKVEPGQVFGFLGPNGSGKTTTIGMLLGIINRTDGEISLFDETGAHGLHAARQRIGATLESPNFYPDLSGYDNLSVTARIKRVDASRIGTALDAVGLTPRKTDLFRKYSLGMKQRLALAAAMLGDPELIILDEPANGLDPEGMHEIREIILGFAAAGKTVFLSSHLLHEVERTCTHVAIIKQGRLLAQGSVIALAGGNASASLQAPDLGALEREVRSYENTVAVSIEDGFVVANLRDTDLASLNRFLTQRNIFVSHLSLHRQSLEDIFMELTQDDATGAAA